MRWFTKHLRNVGIVSVSMLFLLTCLSLIPLSAASAHAGTWEVTTPTTVTVQATPTEDATVTALNKEKLAQEVNQLKNQNSWSPWTNFATPFSIFVALVAASFGFWRWRVDRRDAHDKELKDRQNEREKRAEERFQAAVVGLGDDKEGARIGAAILLRTFLRPGYEQFYAQVFDLAVANLRLPRTSHPPEDPDAALSLTTLSQALIVVFKEAFPLARNQEKRSLQSLDATSINLDQAYLREADLMQAWMPQASLRKVDLSSANLREVNLRNADLRNAYLYETDLRHADLTRTTFTRSDLRRTNLQKAKLLSADLHETHLQTANLQEADLRYANLQLAYLYKADLRHADLSQASFDGTDLRCADLRYANFYQAIFKNDHKTNLDGADLSGANLEDALSLEYIDLSGVKGLTQEQLAACKAKGAIIDDDSTVDEEPTTSSSQLTVSTPPSSQGNVVQVPSASSAQESTPPPDMNGSSTVSSPHQEFGS